MPPYALVAKALTDDDIGCKIEDRDVRIGGAPKPIRVIVPCDGETGGIRAIKKYGDGDSVPWPEVESICNALGVDFAELRAKIEAN